MQYCCGILRFIRLILVAISIFSYSISFAASQGKLGVRSKATVGISVHVNQTLTAIHPEELILKATEQTATYTSQPFCVINQGYGENASVPYELLVEDVSLQNFGDNPAYNVYMKETGSNKKALVQGVSITNQSILTFVDVIENKCKDIDMSIAIESTNPSADPKLISDSPGLLLLLVSPN